MVIDKSAIVLFIKNYVNYLIVEKYISFWFLDDKTCFFK